MRVVERAGGRPLLVPPSERGVDETLDAIDGLILSGGSDLDPELYGQDPHPQTYGVVAERDRGELAMLRAALERDLPVLAICRGSQVLNVALEEGTRLGELLGDRAPVKSHHHQGLGLLGEGLRASEHADDGAVEAVEDPARRFALGVLWHPEAGEDLKLFEALVDEAARYREERRGA